MEDAVWLPLKKIAAEERLTIVELVNQIDEAHLHANLSSAIRICVLNHYQRLATVARKGKR
jgi:predicted DNA-binding ribbon-helix-helix protein